MNYTYNSGTHMASAILGVWIPFTDADFRDAYDCDDAFECAVLHLKTNAIVGKVVKGRTYFTSRGNPIKEFGLGIFVRRIADVRDIQTAKRIKRDAARAKAQANKRRESVTSITYDAQWNVVEKTIETRMVYSNTNGLHIKTRSNGSPTVLEHDGKYFALFVPNLAGRIVNQKVLTVSVIRLLDKS